MNIQKVAILGAGAMGSRFAHNLLNAKYQVAIYNRTANKVKSLLNRGAIYAATPAEAAEDADIVISMVTDDEVSRKIWLDAESGALLGLGKGAIAVESSTLTLAWTQELATRIAQQNSTFLDAPVVGSRPQAEAGKLICLAGGDAEALAQAQPVLLAAGAATVHHIGAVGQGMAMKLAVNALFGVQVAALAEIIGMLSKCGITAKKAMECLGELPVISPVAKGAGNLIVANNHAPMFPISLVEKDFRYVDQMAQAANASMPTSVAAHQVYEEAIAQGYSQENLTGIIQLFTIK
jgi:3-hydroxyisobutyrate dehydrogenase